MKVSCLGVEKEVNFICLHVIYFFKIDAPNLIKIPKTFFLFFMAKFINIFYFSFKFLSPPFFST